MAEQETRPSRYAPRRAVWLALLVGVVVIGAGLWLFWPRTQAPEVTTEAPPPPQEGPGAQAVVLAFPSRDGREWVQEERQIPGRGEALVEDRMLAVMAALCQGPRQENEVGTIPAGTRPLSAFYDDKDGSAILDFSSELATGHPGGSAAELATLTSILRTVALNFPEVRTCRILVDGDEVQTLAGNISMDHPFEPRRWL